MGGIKQEARKPGRTLPPEKSFSWISGFLLHQSVGSILPRSTIRERMGLPRIAINRESRMKGRCKWKQTWEKLRGNICCQSGSRSLKQRFNLNLENPFMAEKTIEEKVKDIIVEQLGVTPEQVTPTASFIEDLGADSLDTVELVMAFEEEFNVEVPDEDAEKLQTVGDVVKYIEDATSK